ncbi:MAG TPA: YncE family protein [Rudaea sp.]
MTHRLATLIATIAALTSLSAHAADGNTWKEQSRHVVGGAGGWDLLEVDAASRRVFITRGDHLMVLDVDSGKAVGDVAGLSHAHGVALVPKLGRGYVSSGGDDRVVAFDLATFKPIGEIATGKNPDAMVYDAASRHVFAFNARSNDATVIDPESNKTIATVPLPGQPELAVSDARGKVFVNLEDKNQIAAIDTRTNAVAGTWSLGSCEEPTGLAIDPAHSRLFSVCANRQMAILDARSGKLVATVPIGDGPDGAAFDPASANAFSSNSDGTLTVVHEDDADHFHVAATVATPARSRTITLDEKTHRVVLPFAQFDAAPAPTAEQPHPRPVMKPGSFGLVVIGKS